MKPKILTLLTLFTFFSSLHTATIHGLLFINPWDVHYVQDSSDSAYWHAVADAPNISINGKVILTITDTLNDTVYQDSTVLSNGEFYIYIPFIDVIEHNNLKPRLIIKGPGITVKNTGNSSVSLVLADVLGRVITRKMIKPYTEENLLKGVLDGVYLLRASSGDVYRLVVYGGSVVSSGGGCEEGVHRIFRLSKVAGERKRYVELRIIPEDTLLHYYLVYPYWPEDTLEDKELLIGLIPKKINIYNPWTNQTETVKINREELLQINTLHTIDNLEEYIVYTDAPCPERPIQKIYLQGFPDTQAIIDTLQALADWMNTQIDSSGLRPYTWPRLVPDPRIIPVKDTTGIFDMYDVPLGAVAILYSTGGGATATDEWNDISNVPHYERWLARGISWADIDYVVNEILKAYLSSHDVTLYFSINGQGGGIKRTTPKDIAYLIIYHNATNHKWEELAGNTAIEVYAYPEGIPIEDTLKLKHHLETYHGY